MREILKTVFLGVRTPLHLDVGRVRRTRPIFIRKVLFPAISVEAIDMVEEKISEEEVIRWGIRRADDEDKDEADCRD